MALKQERTKQVVKIIRGNQDKSLDQITELVTAAGIKTKYGTEYNRRNLVSIMSRYYKTAKKILHPEYNRLGPRKFKDNPKRAYNKRVPTEEIVSRRAPGSDSDKVALAQLILESRVGDGEKLRMIRAVVS